MTDTVNTAAEEKSSLKPESQDEVDEVEVKDTTGCLITNYRNLPKSLRFPMGALRWSILFTLIAYIANFIAWLYVYPEEKQWGDDYMPSLIIGCVQAPVIIGIDLLMNHLVSRAIIFGEQKSFTAYNVIIVLRILFALVTSLGIVVLGHASWLGFLVFPERIVEFGCPELCVSTALWSFLPLILIYAGIHIRVAINKLGGISGIASQKSGAEMSKSETSGQDAAALV